MNRLMLVNIQTISFLFGIGPKTRAEIGIKANLDHILD